MMPEQQNKLGLRDRQDPSYEKEHPKDIDSLLDFSNCLRELAGVETKFKTDPKTRTNLIQSFINQFSYLSNPESKKELITLINKNLQNTDSNNNVVKIQANNSLLLIFRFLDALLLTINKFSQSDSKSALFATDKANLTENKKLQKQLEWLFLNIATILFFAFESYGRSLEEFLTRFDEHKLWQNSLSQKKQMIAIINQDRSTILDPYKPIL